MPRRTLARIHTDAVRHNYARACELAKGSQVMAVIKADGYGHGIREIAKALADRAPKFAVACIEEALAIREAGLEQPVVLLQGPHSKDDVVVSASQGFELVIHSEHQLPWLKEADQCPVLWLKVNSGMNRLGFPAEGLAPVVRYLESENLFGQVVGVVTHFACADDPTSSATQAQTRRFVKAAEPWPHLFRSLGNSAAHFLEGQNLFEWSRPGIMLYGGSPVIGKLGTELGLKPAMTLQAELTSVRTLKPGESVGYGASWTASAETRMGIVAIGYGDGYPRHAGTDTPAWVNGKRIRLLGRVSMDMLAVDLTNAPEASPGDLVELWGENVSIDEVARHAGTIGYELLTGVTARVPRLYESDEGQNQPV